jgi:hypothetical protein
MLTNIVGLYLTWNDPAKALRIKWVELATEQTGDIFDDELVKIVKPV